MTGNKTQTTNSTQTFKLAPELQAKYNDVWNRASAESSNPYQAYTGQLSAGLNPFQTQAGNLSSNNAGLLGMLDPAKILAEIAGTDPGQIAGSDLSKYLNPYTEDVINSSMSDMDRARQMTLLKNGDSAVASGAFAGNRRGVTDALTNADFAREVGSMASGLRKSGFDTATQLRQQDIGNLLNNLTLKLNNANLAGTLQNNSIAQLMGIGTTEQNTSQNALDKLYSQWAEQKNWNRNNITWLDEILGKEPVQGTTSGTQTTKQSGGSVLGNILGGVTGLAGILTGGSSNGLLGMLGLGGNGGGMTFNPAGYAQIPSYSGIPNGLSDAAMAGNFGYLNNL